MGLDISYNAWHGSYSEFHNFRVAICRAAGYGDLNRYRGFDWSRSRNAPKCPHWRTDPLWALLDHSDCSGEIRSRTNLLGIATRLRELVKSGDLERIGSETWNNSLHKWIPKAVLQFARGCEAAAKAGEPLVFR